MVRRNPPGDALMYVVRSLDDCPPAFATPLTPGRPNLGKQCRGVAKMLGFGELAPWQDHFLQLATEYEEGNPEDGIIPWWRYVTLTVPRQCGKSECICAVLYTLRWMGFYDQGGEDPKMCYTSFSLEAAQDQWDTKIGKRMLESEWGQARDLYINHNLMNMHVRQGKKNLMLRGGRIRILSNSGKSGRGGTEDMVIMDEAREFGDDANREKSLDPLMNMRPSPQLMICSTMGTEEAGYFFRKVSAGREQVRSQVRGEWPKARLAYAEWGVGDVRPDSVDASDPKVWRRAHPMLGLANWNEDRMAEKYDLARVEDDENRFKQEYLNCLFSPEDEPGVPFDLLDSVERVEVRDDGVSVFPRVGMEELGSHGVLGLFAEAGNDWLSAAAAGEGRLKVVRPVVVEGERRSVPLYGVVDWLDGYLTNYPNLRTVVVREGNDLAAVLAGWRRRGVRVVVLKVQDWKMGCRELMRAFKMGEVEVERNQYLRIAIQSAERVESADRVSWYWARKRGAQAHVDELQAAVLAWSMAVARTRKGRGIINTAAEGAAEQERVDKWKRILNA